MLKTVIKIILILLLCLSSGCATTLNSIKINTTTASYLNPDEHGNIKPVSISLFQLSNIMLFKNANLKQLIIDSDSTLNDSIIDEETFTVYPNCQKKFKIKYSNDVKFIGIIAKYRKPNPDHWKLILPVTKRQNHTAIAIYLSSHGIYRINLKKSLLEKL